MGIYGSIQKVIKGLDELVFDRFRQEVAADFLSVADKVTVIDGLRSLWPEIEKYAKNICADDVEYMKKWLFAHEPEQYAMTIGMIQYTRHDFDSMCKRWQEDKQVKSFYRSLFEVLELLLIYHLDDEECCRFCQAQMFYFVEEAVTSALLPQVVKECTYCGILSEIRESQRLSGPLRPALVNDLRKLGLWGEG